MAGMQLTVIGCSGSFPGPDSPASCYLLEAEGFRLVMDMGNGALGVLQRHAELFGIDAICVSHLHVDHCVDLSSYWVARQYAPGGSRPPIPVYGPRGTAERVAGFGGEDVAAIRARFEVHHLDPQIGDRAVPDHHRAHEPPGRDVRVPGRARRLDAGLLGRHRRDRRAGPAGRRRGLLLSEASFRDRRHQPAEPAPDRPAGGGARGPGRGRAAGAHPPGAVVRPGAVAGGGGRELLRPAVGGDLRPGPRARSRPIGCPSCLDPMSDPSPNYGRSS